VNQKLRCLKVYASRARNPGSGFAVFKQSAIAGARPIFEFLDTFRGLASGLGQRLKLFHLLHFVRAMAIICLVT
jgi:hypothetical protein